MSDLATSSDRETSEKFRIYYATRTAIAPNIASIPDFSVSVLTTGHWPSFPNTDSVILPPQFDLGIKVRRKREFERINCQAAYVQRSYVLCVCMCMHRFSMSITET